MTRKATAGDLIRILRERSVDLQGLLPVSPVQLSVPTDGKGARIKVSVRPGEKNKVPKMIEFVLSGDTLQLPLEVREDYQDYELYSCESR